MLKVKKKRHEKSGDNMGKRVN